MAVASLAAVGLSAAIATGGAPAAKAPVVHIELSPKGNSHVVLYAEAVGDGPRLWGSRRGTNAVALCVAPCGQELEFGRTQAFYVGGPRLTPSRSFTLPRDTRVDLEVRPGWRFVHGTGWLFAVLGGGAALGGAATMTFADNDRRMLAVGGIMLGSALPTLIIGAVMIGLGRTRVKVHARP